MSFSAGTRLGTYEILPSGAGGMGEVTAPTILGRDAMLRSESEITHCGSDGACSQKGLDLLDRLKGAAWMPFARTSWRCEPCLFALLPCIIFACYFLR
jgi:hypothetical protein